MGKKKGARKVDEKLLFYIWVVQVDLIESVIFEQRHGRNSQCWRGKGSALKTEGTANVRAMRKSLPGEFKDQQCRRVAAMV